PPTNRISFCAARTWKRPISSSCGRFVRRPPAASATRSMRLWTWPTRCGVGRSARVRTKAMNDTQDRPDLGLCCNCQAQPALAVAWLRRRAPVAGPGWGCVVCDLPLDGAVAVLCDACADALEMCEQPPRFVCVGAPSENRRLPYTDLPAGAFDHDASKHTDELG